MTDPKHDPKKDFQFTETQARLGVACVMALLFFSVIAGYYWGKKRAYEEFLDTCYAESLSDKIAASLCSLYDASDDEDGDADAAEATGQDNPRETTEAQSEGPQAAGQQQAEGRRAEGQAPQTIIEDNELYFAELAGFGVLRTAKNYATRLADRGFKVKVLERASKSGRGKSRTWYQVVTAPLGYEALQEVVDKIKSEDRLQGVVLVEYTKKHNEQFERSVA